MNIYLEKLASEDHPKYTSELGGAIKGGIKGALAGVGAGAAIGALAKRNAAGAIAGALTGVAAAPLTGGVGSLVGRDNAKRKNFEAQVKQAAEHTTSQKVSGNIGAVAGGAAGLYGGMRAVASSAVDKIEDKIPKALQVPAAFAAMAGTTLAGAAAGRWAGHKLAAPSHEKSASAIVARVEEELAKEASNAFSRNIMALAKKEGSSGGRGFALRQAANLPASAAKSPALQEALRAPSARAVSGNPAVNREITGMRDIGNTSRFKQNVARKTGIGEAGSPAPAPLEADKHFGILDTKRAIDKL